MLTPQARMLRRPVTGLAICLAILLVVRHPDSMEKPSAPQPSRHRLGPERTEIVPHIGAGADRPRATSMVSRFPSTRLGSHAVDSLNRRDVSARLPEPTERDVYAHVVDECAVADDLDVDAPGLDDVL